jgi:hypothetical protein
MNTCTHPRLIPGLEGNYCPDCHRLIPPSISVNPDCENVYGNDPPEIHQAVYEVPSHGKRYYRYLATQGRQVLFSLHIPGGSTQNPKAQARATAVRSWIAAHQSPEHIQQRIDAWRW